MISVDITLSHEQFKMIGVLRSIPGAAAKAAARAINRAAEGARTDAIKAICEQYAIKPVTVRKTLTIKMATEKKLTAEIISTGSQIGLYKFFVSPKKPQNVPVEKRKTVIAGVKFGTKEKFPHGFVAWMEGGHEGLWHRTGGKTRSGRREISEFFGPSVPQMLGNKHVLDFINKGIHERLDKELRRQISYLLGG
ncbi:MAG: phage tail protein, partial [Synergistaceae bacterium]|nr:phage tail protein [Synergistaceae bacterium]